MTDLPKAIAKEVGALERTHRAYVREPTDRTHKACLTARAALVSKIRMLLDAALSYERIPYSAIPAKVDALLSVEP